METREDIYRFGYDRGLNQGLSIGQREVGDARDALKKVELLLRDAGAAIDELEQENARLAQRAIDATRERDRAEHRVAELELRLDVEHRHRLGAEVDELQLMIDELARDCYKHQFPGAVFVDGRPTWPV